MEKKSNGNGWKRGYYMAGITIAVLAILASFIAYGQMKGTVEHNATAVNTLIEKVNVNSNAIAKMEGTLDDINEYTKMLVENQMGQEAVVTAQERAGRDRNDESSGDSTRDNSEDSRTSDG